MRSTIILTAMRNGNYKLNVAGKFGGGYTRHLSGEAHEIAAIVAEASLHYCASNAEGGDVMAPPEIMDLIPEHLRSVRSEAAERGSKGGSATSKAKQKASRDNGKKGGRPSAKKTKVE